MTDLADIFADEFGVPRRTPEQAEALDRKLADMAGLSLGEFRARREFVDQGEDRTDLTPRERFTRELNEMADEVLDAARSSEERALILERWAGLMRRVERLR